MPSIQRTRVHSPSGNDLEVTVDLPDTDGPLPALVIAPGNRYPMSGPLLAQIARSCLDRQVAVFRFAWAHDAKNASASEDLVRETQDTAAVLEFAIRHPQTDPGRVFAGGKSVGSIAAWNLFIRDERLRRAVLLTPICPAGDAGARSYPSLEHALRPVLIIAGDQDPYCDLAGVTTSAGAASTVKLAVLAGNHDLMAAAQAQTASLERAGKLVADFIVTQSNLNVNTLPCKP